MGGKGGSLWKQLTYRLSDQRSEISIMWNLRKQVQVFLLSSPFSLFLEHFSVSNVGLDFVHSIQEQVLEFLTFVMREYNIIKVMIMCLSFYSDMSFKGGGYLSIEDSHGSPRSIFLEEGFLDYLNKVLHEHHWSSCLLCAHLRCTQ